MKTKFRQLLLCALCVLFYTTANSQEVKPLMENEKQIIFKISSYSVDTDKLVHKEFSSDKDIKIVYTCIQTGVIVFESNNIITQAKKEEIQKRLNKAYESIQFLHLQGFTIKDAEEKCAAKRSIN